jgi:hypothetical protein
MKNIDINTQKILDKFPELSDGIGCLQNYEQSLHVDPTVPPPLLHNALGESLSIYESKFQIN